MTPLHYTVDQVNKLKPDFKAMLKEVITEVLGCEDPSELNYRKEFMVDNHPFEFIIKASVIRALSSASTQVATACTILHGHPYVINFEEEDFQKPVEEVISDAFLDQLTDSFMSSVLCQMARAWYDVSYRDRINTYARSQSFDSIQDLIEYPVRLNWDDHGYEVGVYNDGLTGPQYLFHDYHFTAAVQEKRPVNNQNVDIFCRYLDNGLIVLAATGRIFKGWSNTLN